MFSSYQALDTLDAIGLMADFTTATLPDVVTIPRGPLDDTSTVSEMICSMMNADGELPVFVYSRERNADARCLSIEEISERLMLQGGRGEN